MAVLKYYDGSDWEPVVSALQGPTGPTGAASTITGPTGATGVAIGLPTGGATGAVLVKTSNADYATAWTTAGKILQVVNATYATQTGSTSTTFADTGLSASITPTLSSSKVLIFVSINGVLKHVGNSETACNLRLVRASTSIIDDWSRYLGYTGSSAYNLVASSVNYLDSPATTSATTYKVQFRTTVSGQLVDVQRDGATSTITLMEVAV
jgi:hypothetical protein